MKVFVCWSGPVSEKLGEAIRDWLPNVLQSVKPYFTPADIDKGAQWLPDISAELLASKVGIICVTPENIQSDWIHFEAGALSKTLEKSRVCPVLFRVKSTDLTGPLKQFQATNFEQKDFRKLVTVINGAMDDRKLEPKTLENVFTKFWPDLETAVNGILAGRTESEEPIRSEHEILEELLLLARNTSVLGPVRSRVPAAVVKDLLEAFVSLHDGQARHEGGYQDTLDGLREMKKPIGFLVSRYLADPKSDSTLADRFRELSYKELPKEAFEGDDDNNEDEPS